MWYDMISRIKHNVIWTCRKCFVDQAMWSSEHAYRAAGCTLTITRTHALSHDKHTPINDSINQSNIRLSLLSDQPMVLHGKQDEMGWKYHLEWKYKSRDSRWDSRCSAHKKDMMMRGSDLFIFRCIHPSSLWVLLVHVTWDCLHFTTVVPPKLFSIDSCSGCYMQIELCFRFLMPM